MCFCTLYCKLCWCSSTLWMDQSFTEYALLLSARVLQRWPPWITVKLSSFPSHNLRRVKRASQDRIVIPKQVLKPLPGSCFHAAFHAEKQLMPHGANILTNRKIWNPALNPNSIWRVTKQVKGWRTDYFSSLALQKLEKLSSLKMKKLTGSINTEEALTHHPSFSKKSQSKAERQVPEKYTSWQQTLWLILSTPEAHL